LKREIDGGEEGADKAEDVEREFRDGSDGDAGNNRQKRKVNLECMEESAGLTVACCNVKSRCES